MRLRNYLLIFLTAFLYKSVEAKEAAQVPDPELLEFLGTFEGDGKKGVDPLELSDLLNEGKSTVKSSPKKSKDEKEKKDGKENQK